MFAISLGDDGAELRPLEPWNAEEYLAHLDRSREHIGRFVGLPDRCPDLESARSFLQEYAAKQAADSGRLYGIWRHGTLVGGCMFRTFDAANGTCEIGCWLEESAVGAGLVTRAVTVLIDWAAEARGIHRFEWQVAPENTASIKVAQRLGMRHEGTLRQNTLFHGTRQDTEVWSLLTPDRR